MAFVHGTMSAIARKLFAPPYAWRRRITSLISLDLRLPVFVHRGTLRDSRQPFCFAHAGRYPTTGHHWAKNFLAGGYSTRELGAAAIWTVEAKVRRSGFDCKMLLLETSALTRRLVEKRMGFTVPLWLQMEMDIRPSIKALCSNSKAGLGNISRLMRKHGITGELVRDPRLLEDFYRNMYVPLVRGRHGEASELVTFEKMKRISRSCDMLVIRRLGDPIAASLISHERKKPALRFIGVRDGSHELISIGAEGASYYCAATHLKSKGFDTMDIGGTSPLVNDGLTAFKKRLKAEIIAHTYLSGRCLRLVLLDRSEGVLDALAANPFVFYPSDHAPHLAMFVRPGQVQDRERLRRLLDAAKIPGTRGTCVHVFEEDERTRQWIAEMGDPTVTVFRIDGRWAAA